MMFSAVGADVIVRLSAEVSATDTENVENLLRVALAMHSVASDLKVSLEVNS